MSTASKQVLKKIEKEAEAASWSIIGPEKGKLLEKIVKTYKPKNILEVGSLVGYSAILMGQHLPKGGKITTIEIKEKVIPIARENLKKAGVEKSVQVLNGDAMKVIPKLDEKFDMVFLDAEKEEYYSYLLLAENKLDSRAIVVADNVKLFENEVRDYLEYVRENDKYESQNFDFDHDAVEVSFKKG